MTMPVVLVLMLTKSQTPFVSFLRVSIAVVVFVYLFTLYCFLNVYILLQPQDYLELIFITKIRTIGLTYILYNANEPETIIEYDGYIKNFIGHYSVIVFFFFFFSIYPSEYLHTERWSNITRMKIM